MANPVICLLSHLSKSHQLYSSCRAEHLQRKVSLIATESIAVAPCLLALKPIHWPACSPFLMWDTWQNCHAPMWHKSVVIQGTAFCEGIKC